MRDRVKIISKLARIADELDRRGKVSIASEIDQVIRKVAAEPVHLIDESLYADASQVIKTLNRAGADLPEFKGNSFDQEAIAAMKKIGITDSELKIKTSAQGNTLLNRVYKIVQSYNPDNNPLILHAISRQVGKDFHYNRSNPSELIDAVQKQAAEYDFASAKSLRDVLDRIKKKKARQKAHNKYKGTTLEDEYPMSYVDEQDATEVVSKSVPKEPPQVPQAKKSPEFNLRTANIQQMLNSAGQNVKVDGLWGRATEQAISNLGIQRTQYKNATELWKLIIASEAYKARNKAQTPAATPAPPGSMPLSDGEMGPNSPTRL